MVVVKTGGSSCTPHVVESPVFLKAFNVQLCLQVYYNVTFLFQFASVVLFS